MSSKTTFGGLSKSRSDLLYAIFRAQLKAFRPDLDGFFLCPLCRKLFSENDFAAGKLSFAHIVPAFLGGKLGVVLCTHCNSRIGHRIEGEAAKIEAAIGPVTRRTHGYFPAEFLAETPFAFRAPLRIDIDPCTDERSFVVHPRIPLRHRLIVEAMLNGIVPMSCALQEPPHIDADRAALLAVSVGYHAMFGLFGYEFTESVLGQSMRSMLLEEAPPYRTRFNYEATPSPPTPGVVSLVDSSPMSYWVFLPPSLAFAGYDLLWLPALDKPCEIEYLPDMELVEHKRPIEVGHFISTLSEDAEWIFLSHGSEVQVLTSKITVR